MDSKNVKLFDLNDHLVPNFDEEIEKILISIHGENYYDVDEALINTNIIPIITEEKTEEEIEKEEELSKTVEFVDSLVDDDAPKIQIVEKKKSKISIKDFAPVLFFILIFAVIVIAGYYFLNNFDLASLIK